MIPEVGKNLFRLRQEMELSQREAAGELGISQALLSHYENGLREPGLSFLLRACDFYHVSADYLLGRTAIREEAQLQLPEPTGNKDKKPVPQGTIPRFYYRVLKNAMAVLFDLLGRMGDDTALATAYEYLGTGIYRLYRHLARYSPDGTLTLLSVEDLDVTVGATSADMMLCELEYHYALKRRVDEKKPFPPTGYKKLEETYPNQYRSLYEIIHTGGRRNQHMVEAHRQESGRLAKDRREKAQKQAHKG
jgi:transcriptional regulator with XRE-family HTH domain